MIPFFSILSKQYFTSLHKFGSIPLGGVTVISRLESDSHFELEIEHALKCLPFFSGDEEYIFIHFGADSVYPVRINIEDVIEIIPMTEAARVSLNMKFKAAMPLSKPRFYSIVTRVSQFIEIEDRLNGVKVLNKLFKINTSEGESLQRADIQRMISIRSGLSELREEDSMVVRLMSYDRHENFPNNDLGYIYDGGEIFASSKGASTFKGTKFYNFLEGEKSRLRETKLSSILGFLDLAPEALAYNKGMSITGLNFGIITALYLRLKDVLKSNIALHDSEIPKIVEYNLSNTKAAYPVEIRVAVELIGAFFGYDRFYEAYYAELHAIRSDVAPVKAEMPYEWTVKSHGLNSDSQVYTSTKSDNSSDLFTEVEEPKSIHTYEGIGLVPDSPLREVLELFTPSPTEVKTDVLKSLKVTLQLKKKSDIYIWLRENGESYLSVNGSSSSFYVALM